MLNKYNIDLEKYLIPKNAYKGSSLADLPAQYRRYFIKSLLIYLIWVLIIPILLWAARKPDWIPWFMLLILISYILGWFSLPYWMDRFEHRLNLMRNQTTPVVQFEDLTPKYKSKKGKYTPAVLGLILLKSILFFSRHFLSKNKDFSAFLFIGILLSVPVPILTIRILWLFHTWRWIANNPLFYPSMINTSPNNQNTYR